jgi:peptidylprolyl isomerase
MVAGVPLVLTFVKVPAAPSYECQNRDTGFTGSVKIFTRPIIPALIAPRRYAAMRRFQHTTFSTLAIALTVLTASAVSMPNTAMAQTAGKAMTTASGLQIIDSKVGTGATPKPGQICVVHYTGWLYQDGQKGKKFDSSVDRNDPLEFPVGQRKVIAGWDEGVASMKVGGKRTLIIPPELGYGARGAGGVIPPNATLIFDVELLDVKG